MTVPVRGAFAGLLLTLAGCGSSASATGGAPPAPVIDLPAGFEAPASPAALGWIPPECDASSMPVLGESSCVPLGAPCDGSGWPEEVQGAGRAFYVQPGARGDGSSRASPLGFVYQSLALAKDGDVVYLAEGRHLGFVVKQDLRIVGACAERTVVETTVEDGDTATVEYTRGGAGTLERVTITGPAPGVWAYETTKPITVRNVAVRGSKRFAVTAGQRVRELDLDHVFVDGVTQWRPTDGRGIELDSGKTSLRAVTVRGAFETGVAALSGGTLEAERVAILATQAARLPGNPGYGLTVEKRTRATFAGALVRGAGGVGVLATDEGTTFDATDLAIEDVEGNRAGALGYGLRAQIGVRVGLTRASIVRARTVGLVSTTKSALALTDVTVRETRSQSSDGDMGIGVAFLESVVSGRRVAIDASRAAGLVVARAAEVSLAQLLVRGVEGIERDGSEGLGLGVVGASKLTLERALVQGTHTHGALVGDSGTFVSASDLVLRRVASSKVNGKAGGGLGVTTGAKVTLTRARIEDVKDYGLLVAGDSASVVADSLEVERVGRAACAVDGLAACSGSGVGILVMGADLRAKAFRVANSASIGFVAYDPNRASDPELKTYFGANLPKIALERGIITRNVIGVNLQTPGIDVATAFVDVESYENPSGDFTSDELPLPNPEEAFTGVPMSGGAP
jgi:hypothetical protein